MPIYNTPFQYISDAGAALAISNPEAKDHIAAPDNSRHKGDVPGWPAAIPPNVNRRTRNNRRQRTQRSIAGCSAT